MNGVLQRSSGCLVVGGALLVCAWLPQLSFACQDKPNPKAFAVLLPGEHVLLPNGLLVQKYVDRSAEHRLHVTVHRVVMVLPGRHPNLPEWRDPRYLVLETNGTISPMTYLVLAHALYYGVGVDALGFPLKSWIDPDEDGLNGNEHPTRTRD